MLEEKKKIIDRKRTGGQQHERDREKERERGGWEREKNSGSQ